MKTTFYCGPGVCGLKFDSPADRDKFWSDLSDPHRAAAEKIKARTIRFYPAKMVEPGFQWPLAVPVSNGPVAIHQPAPIPPAPPKTDLVTTSPFDHLTQNPTRALPGIVPPPPPEMLAVNQPIAATTPSGALYPVNAVKPAIEEVNTVVEIPPAAPSPAQPKDDPEPNVDKRSRVYREWKERQKK